MDAPPERCLMIGDRLETDVLLGLNNSMDAALVLTGATSQAELAASSIAPTYVLESLADLLPAALQARTKRESERNEDPLP